MAIAVKLDDMLHDRRMTLTDLADRVGMTLANLSILKTGKARAIRFSTLDAICEALKCQPGDILRFEDEGDGRETNRRRGNEGRQRWLTETPIQRYDPGLTRVQCRILSSSGSSRQRHLRHSRRLPTTSCGLARR